MGRSCARVRTSTAACTNHASKSLRLHRNRPLTWRSSLPWLIPIALLAAGSDAALWSALGQRCPRCGGAHVRLELLFAAVAFTLAAVGLVVAVCKSTLKAARDAAGRSRTDVKRQPRH